MIPILDHFDQVSVFDRSSAAVFLIVGFDWAFLAVHAYDEWRGEEAPLSRVFGAIVSGVNGNALRQAFSDTVTKIDLRRKIMKRATKITMTLFALSLFIQNAFAGEWQYGCAGQLNGQDLFFDRGQLVILPTGLAKGDVRGIAEGDIQTFEAQDNNSGFEKTMVYQHTWSNGEKSVITLNEKSVTKVYSKSRDIKCTANRSRNESKTRTVRKYELQHDGASSSVKLQCYEHIVTACG